jgi:arylsulfatase A-like enzyme
MRTPVIDALRLRGVSLTNYYVQPVCSPTRGSLLAAKFPVHLGYDGVIHDTEPMGVPLSDVLLPQALRAAGYATHLLGKWHIGMFKPALLPINRGFDTAFGYLCGSTGYWDHGNTEAFCDPEAPPAFVLDLTNGSRPATGAHGRRWNGTYETQMYSAALEEVLDSRTNLTQPLFLYIAPNNVHTPLGAPAAFYEGFAGVASKGRREFSATAAALDAFVANVTGSLGRRGLMEGATFVFTTDNGGNLRGSGNNWPLRGGKFTTWEGGVRGIAFVVSPAIPPRLRGTAVDGLSHAVDWAPTLLDLVVVAGSGQLQHGMGAVDGVSILPMLCGGRDSNRTEIPHSVPKVSGTGVLRTGDYKLISGFPGDGQKTGCTGGCWCPLPDAKTGIMTCIPPPNPATAGGYGSFLVVGSEGEGEGEGEGRRSNPPSAKCAAAMSATGCGRTEHAPKACAACSRPFNASLLAAGCRAKDPRHWCNNHIGPPGPAPPPGPGPPLPPPPAGAMPCALAPCLFDIRRDPLEQHDLAAEQPAVVATMMARLEELRAGLLVSPFGGGHHNAAACAAWAKSGGVSPWEQ